MNRQNSIVIFLLFLSLATNGQAPTLYFDNINTQNGLSNNTVNCLLQDQRGFIWMGTNDGLNRYDGNNFVVFRNRPGDNTSISGNLITHLHEDKQGVLWVATADGGMTRYDYRLPPALQFKQYKHQPGDTNSIPINIVNALLEDAQGYLWLATGGNSVIRFNKQTNHFDKPFLPGPKTILALHADKDGLLWMGRQGGGIVKVNPVSLTWQSDLRYENLYAKLPHVAVTAIFCDSKKNMWYGSWDKILYQYHHASQTEKSFDSGSFVNDEVMGFAEDQQGRIWIGGKTKGLQLYDPEQDRFYHYVQDPLKEGSLANNTIRCIYIDRSGRVWMGTDKGLSICHPGRQQFVQTFLPGAAASATPLTIYDFYKDENKDLWIGTSKGIYLQQHLTTGFRHRPVVFNGQPLAVTKFFRDSRGAFYIGTNYSLFIYDKTRNTVRLLPNTEKDQVMNRIIESRVVSVVEEKIEGRPVLLVSPYGHYLAYYDLEKQQWVSRLDTARHIIRRFNIKDNLVHKLYKTGNGNLWLANARAGLGAWSGGTTPSIQFYQNNPLQSDGLSNNHVYDMAEDASGNLWLSTYGGGLNYMEPATRKIHHIPATNNLLEGIATDRKGQVWMISNGNLHRYAPAMQAGTSFHLPDIEKSGGVSGYIYTDAEGYMYAAGNGYYIRFHPDSIVIENPQPRVLLTDFKIFNNSYSHLLNDKTIELSYQQNYFTIEFSAPNYERASPVQYAYMLVGEDGDWINCGNRNYAPYSNLEGGTYIFKVKAGNNPGNWSEHIYTIKIIITPPVWKRWWFYLLCAVLLAASVYAVYRYRINELLKRQAIRNKIAQDLHDNVGSTLSSISVYSQVAQIQNNAGAKEELQEVLGKISTTSTDMIAEMSDTVWAINPRNDSMEKILQRMESFARPLLAARNIRFQCQYDKETIHTQLAMEKRKNLYLIFKEAINNAVKYSGAKEVVMTISLTHRQLQLVIKDDGVGFNPEREMHHSSGSLSGNGLRNMQSRAAEMKGSLQISSNTGQGTVVTLQCPIP
jgi:ligand-binding sensor domain-containing protein/signal transduction histidine kinase